MKTLKTSCTALCISAAMAAGGFPNVTVAAQDTRIINAEYSLVFPDTSRLHGKPTEVRIVKVEHMQKAVASKIALGVLLFVVAGGTTFTTNSKDNIHGAAIDGLEDRSNIQIPDPEAFASRLQSLVNDAAQANEALATKTFKKPLTLAGGSTRLTYESLIGEETQLYRLKTDWVVYKLRESFFALTPPTVVNCGSESATPLSQSDWAQDNYAKVKAEMDAVLARCEQKVLAAVPELLND